MRALTWQGNLDVRVTDVPDPRIQETERRHHRGHLGPRSAALTCTCTGSWGRTCPPGDVLGHEAMGVVTEVGGGRHQPGPLATGWSSRSTSPCGHLLDVHHRGPVRPSARPTQVPGARQGGRRCSATRRCTGSVPGGQAPVSCGSRRRSSGPVKIPGGRGRTSSTCSCPTCWPTRLPGLSLRRYAQGTATLAVLGPGAHRASSRRGSPGTSAVERVIGVDPVCPERRARRGPGSGSRPST